MVNKTVYLAGPISGLTYDEATGWREVISACLAGDGIKCLSPLRAEVYLRNHKGLLNDIQGTDELVDTACQVRAMCTQRGVFARDKLDAENCSVLLLNVLGAKKISIGSVLEVGWANANKRLIVLVMEEGNPHDHCFMREAADFRTDSLVEATDIIKAILGDY